VNWLKVKLGEIAKVVGGSTPRRENKEFWDGTIAWVTPTDLSMPGQHINLINETSSYITEKGLSSCSAQILPIGTVLFSSRATIGKVGIAQVPLTTNQGFANFIPKNVIDSKFLAYVLMFSAKNIESLAGSTTFKEVTKTSIRKYEISLPPPTEQRRIVEILDQADKLRRQRAEADQKAERILPALFLKMFGDPATNPKGWRFKTLEELKGKVRYGLGQPPQNSINGLPLIRATNIHKGQISEINLMRVNEEDVPLSRNAFLLADEVIVVRSGAYTGDVAQVTSKWEGSVAGYDLVVTPGENFTGEFVESYLLTEHIQKNYFGRLKARAGQPHLNSAQLLETPFPVVPKNHQSNFSLSVQNIREILNQRQKSFENLNNLFSNLLYRAFSGELTASWRERHLTELLAEMEIQRRELVLSDTKAAKLF
jgi:type I restriction enzyme, S subunit